MNNEVRRNHKGKILEEWILEKEDKDFFVLRKASGKQTLIYPKTTFEADEKNEGASREGDKFYIPERPQAGD